MTKGKHQMSGKDIKNVLLLRDGNKGPKLGVRMIAKRVGISKSTCQRWLERIAELQLTREAAESMSDEALHELVAKKKGPKEKHFPIDLQTACELIHSGNISTTDLFEQYKKDASESGIAPLSRSAFFNRIHSHWSKHFKGLDKEMSQQWEPGEYMQIDFAGDKLVLQPGPDGKKYTVRFFVCTLCHSRMIYCYATKDATTESWLEGIINALEYFGGSPKYIILDNDVALVKSASRGDKQYVKAFEDLCRYYHMQPSAARVRTPRDKGMVEGAVRIITESFIKKIQPESMRSIEDVQFLLCKEVEKINQRKIPKRQISRMEWYEANERKKLRKLPATRFTVSGPLYKRVVQKDGCIGFDGHDYGVPREFFGGTVGVRVIDGDQLQILDLVKSTVLCTYNHYAKGVVHEIEGFTHIKPEFRLPGELTPKQRLEKARERVCGQTEFRTLFFNKLIQRHGHEEQGAYADILNRIAKQLENYGEESIEISCRRLVNTNLYSEHMLFKHLENSQNGYEDAPSPSPQVGACVRDISEFKSKRSETFH